MPLGQRIGSLTREAAGALGLPTGIPIGEGGIDAHVGLLGLITGCSNVNRAGV